MANGLPIKPIFAQSWSSSCFFVIFITNKCYIWIIHSIKSLLKCWKCPLWRSIANAIYRRVVIFITSVCFTRNTQSDVSQWSADHEIVIWYFRIIVDVDVTLPTLISTDLHDRLSDVLFLHMHETHNLKACRFYRSSVQLFAIFGRSKRVYACKFLQFINHFSNAERQAICNLSWTHNLSATITMQS